MRRLIFIICMVFLISSVSSVELNINKEYDQGETVIGKISGNFVNPPSEENLFLYREHVRVPIDSEVLKINDEYYFYFILDNSPGNYSFVIEDTEYYTGADTSEEDISRNITLSNKTADFGINQGVFDINNTFSIVFNSLSPSGIEIYFSESNNSDKTGKIEPFSENFPLELRSGEKNKVYFILKNFDKSSFKELKFSSENTEYNIPVFVSADVSSDSNTTYENDSQNKSFKQFSFSPEELNLSLDSDTEDERFYIYLNNTGTEKIEDISFSVSDKLKENIGFYEDTLDELSPGSTAKIKFTAIPSENPKTLQGYILAESSDRVYTRSKINLETYSNDSSDHNNSDNGFNLDDNDSGNGIEINYSDRDNGSDESSTQQIIGWSLLALIVIFVTWFYFKKYKGTTNTPKKPISRKRI